MLATDIASSYLDNFQLVYLHTGDILFLFILLYKTLQHKVGHEGSSVENVSSLAWGNANNSTTTLESGHPVQYAPILPDYLQLDDRYNMKDLLFFIAIGIISAELFYHVLCGYLQIYYYVLQRENPEKWKCQPNRFLSRSNEVHEVVVGTFNLIIAGIMSGFLSCWVMNDNYSAFYYKIDQFGYLYFFSSIPLIFLWTEAMAYYSHRLLHIPVLYRLIHKQHHRYHTPTPYSVLAMSPFELILYQTLTLFPVFVVPIHPFVFIFNLVYVFYYSVMDHSGIKMEALWPWQPNTIFHDDHHK